MQVIERLPERPAPRRALSLVAAAVATFRGWPSRSLANFFSPTRVGFFLSKAFKAPACQRSASGPPLTQAHTCWLEVPVRQHLAPALSCPPCTSDGFRTR